MTPPTESATVEAPTLGPWPINTEPFWRHGGKRFVAIMWWLAVTMTLMLGSTGSSLPRPIEVAMVVVTMACLLIPGGAALVLWGLANRARNDAARKRLGLLAWKAVAVLIVLLMTSVTGMVVVGVAIRGWTPPPLGAGIAMGSIVAIGAILGTLGYWAWLLSSKSFAVGRDWLVPTSYGIVRHKRSRIPLSDLQNCVLYLPDPSEPEDGHVRFHWFFDAGELGSCDIDSGVLDEAHVPAESLVAIRDRVIAINASRGGRTKSLTPRMEVDLAISHGVGQTGGGTGGGQAGSPREAEGPAPPYGPA